MNSFRFALILLLPALAAISIVSVLALNETGKRLKQLEAAQTHDLYWNAAMKEMKVTGFMHNYMRMYWGKKILEWSASPEEAFERALRLNDRWFLDGRDPNSYTGIFWVLGRHDRPWGPERPIFGKVRYMSSESTRRKLKLTEYLGQSKMLNT